MVWKANVTLNNVSPLINYSPAAAWHEGDSRDPSWSLYDHGGTFTLTTQFGANASVAFNGTAVWVIGAKRGNHAPYSTTLDNRQSSDTGYSSTDEFQQALFTRTELDSGPHNVSITNLVDDAGKPYLDIDSIVYEVEIPDGYVQNPPVEDTDDTHFNFSSSTWSTNPQDVSRYSNGTGHTTSSADAFVVFTFEVGSSVEIYGAVGPLSGDYTVQVDGGGSIIFNGTKNALVPQTLLYQNNNLVPEVHTVKISNSPYTGQILSIDFAITYGPSTNLDTDSGGGSSSSRMSKGAIGGIAVGGCAGVLLVLVGVFLWHRRRSRRSGLTHAGDPSGLVDYGTGPVTFHTPSLPLTTERYPPLLVPTTVVHPPSTSPPQSNSSASNSDSRHRLIMHNPNPSLTGPADLAGALLDIAPVPPDTRPPQTPADTLRPLPQPGNSDTRLLANASVLPLLPLPGTDLRNMRMQVEGRSQDFGPIVFIPEPEHEGNLLPPDYYQATEPFPPLPR